MDQFATCEIALGRRARDRMPMRPQGLDFGDALSVVGQSRRVFVVIGPMRQPSFA